MVCVGWVHDVQPSTILNITTELFTIEQIEDVAQLMQTSLQTLIACIFSLQPYLHMLGKSMNSSDIARILILIVSYGLFDWKPHSLIMMS